MVCQQKSFKIIVLIMALFTIFSFDSFHSVVQAQSMTYTVQPGDTLSAIAVRFGTSMQEIAAANGIQNINAIRVGQALLVPSGITSGSTPSNPTITAPVISSAQVQVPYAPVTSQTYVPAAPIQGRSAQSAEEPSRRPQQPVPTNGYVGNGCAVSPGPGERIHQVRPGDTLYGIAASSGVTIIAVRQRNGLTSDRIRVGECLIVPSGYVVTPVPDRRRDSERSQEAEGPLPVPSPVPVEPSTPRVSQSRG